MNAIAIVGMGLRYPGANNAESFWDMVREGKDNTREVPPGRWVLPPELAAGGKEPGEDKVRAIRGGFVEPLGRDLLSGELSRDLLQSLDPSVQLAVHTGLEAAGGLTRRLDPDRTHIILGQLLLPTESTSAIVDAVIGDTIEESVLGDPCMDDRRPRGYPTCHPLDRHDASLPATALRAALGLRSSAWTLDAACASALYAVARACEDLREGRCDHALAGGVSRPDALFTQMGFSQLRALSPEGRCRPLDDRGQGLVVGEGAGILVLRRLKDAELNGDPILGVIKGWGLSNDRSGGLLAPSGEGQVRAMQHAYDLADWSPRDVDYIECHATGTPVGDATELTSLAALWENEEWRNGQCALGSVKSSIGHTLTAAGSAGLIKVLLAMKHGEVPPLPDQRNAPGDLDMAKSPFRIPDSAEPWLRQTGRPRRSAVSAFGFGGINAHVLVEEYAPEIGGGKNAQEVKSPVPNLNKKPSADIAIVGYGVLAGPHMNRMELRSTLLTLDSVETSTSQYPGHYGVPDSLWVKEEGLRLEPGLTTGPLRGSPVSLKIPPTELQEMLPQQLALLQVAREALEHSGRSELGIDGSIFVGLGLDPRSSFYHLRWMLPERGKAWLNELGIEAHPEDVDHWIQDLQNELCPPLNANRVMGALGSIAASRLARELGAGGPAHTVSNDHIGGFRALEQAIHTLQEGKIEIAVAAAADFGLDVIQRLCDARESKGSRSDAAVALILRRLDDAKADGQEIHGIIEGTGSTAADSLFSGSRTLPSERATQIAMKGNTKPNIVLNPGDHPINLTNETRESGIRVISLPGPLDNCGCATPLLSVVQGIEMFSAAVLPSLSQDRTATPWIPAITEDCAVRIDCRGQLGDHGSLVMRKDNSTEKAPTPNIEILGDTGWGMLVIEGDPILEEIRSFQNWLMDLDLSHLSPTQISKMWLDRSPLKTTLPQAVGILFKDIPSLLQASPELSGVFENQIFDLKGQGWEIIRSHPTALGYSGDVGFIYPGSGSLYPGAGRQLFTRFTGCLTSARDDGGMLRRMISDSSFWSPVTPIPMDVREAILAQVSLGCFGTDLLRGFGLSPAIACGHSLGQTAMLFALGIWKNRQEMQSLLEKGNLFDTWLGGEFRAAREAWSLKNHEEVDWGARVVDRPLDEIEDAIQHQNRIYRLIVNASNETVIGGRNSDLDTLIHREGWSAVPLEGVTSVHCPLVQAVEFSYRDLHLWAVNAPSSSTQILCTATAKILPIESGAIADSILQQALSGFNFPNLVQEMWNQGTRIFIEPGPGASCSRLVRKTLGNSSYRTLPLFWRGEDEELSLARLLLTCAVERIEVDLGRYFGSLTPSSGQEPTILLEDGRNHRTIPPLPISMKRISLQQWESTPIPQINTETKRAQPTSELTVAETSSPLIANPTPPVLKEKQSTMSRKEQIQSRLKKARTLRESLIGESPNLLTEVESLELAVLPATLEPQPAVRIPHPEALFDRDLCLEFARGQVGPVLGPKHGEADTFPTRVRLPDEPLMLVDRILSMEGEPLTLGKGRIVTAHDVLPGNWYLDSGRIPTSIAVESGQADLFLSGYLGADLHTRGYSVYRLLDAQVIFHSELPEAGKTIIYDIHIDEFFHQDKTLLFRFHFDATVDGVPFLSMKEGCAGFFSPTELASGRGIVQSPHKPKPPRKFPENWSPHTSVTETSLDSHALASLRDGDLQKAFGSEFSKVHLSSPWTLPGGKMTLIDHIPELQTHGGEHGLGRVVGELAIQPDDWFLTCHFSDDPVMPGTLMYESCIHTLRVLLMSWGWVGEDSQIIPMPVPEVPGRLRCRGQVTPDSQRVRYEVVVHEVGYRPEPYVIASALMFADGKAIVEMEGLSLRLVGLSEEQLHRLWGSVQKPSRQNINSIVFDSTSHPLGHQGAAPVVPLTMTSSGGGGDDPAIMSAKPTLYDHQSILDYAMGKPSAAFGDRYQVFDGDRFIARLPGPPYCFLDRIVEVTGDPWVVNAGASCTAEYKVPSDAWYFSAGGTGEMPFAILLEIALQPCGWLAGYVGSALTEEGPLHFRNLGGEATLLRPITPDTQCLTTRVKLTSADHGAGMWIQHFDLEVDDENGPIYRGNTYFGFFPPEALAAQVGLPGAVPKTISPRDALSGRAFSLKELQPGPTDEFRMLDEVEIFLPEGGASGLGYIRGSIDVDASAWFFQAHFKDDPVWPGSLGLESMLQLLQVVANDRWGSGKYAHRTVAPGVAHSWTYRGQIIPTRKKVVVEAHINERDEERGIMRADGMLIVDDLPIYGMQNFTVERRNEK